MYGTVCMPRLWIYGIKKDMKLFDQMMVFIRAHCSFIAAHTEVALHAFRCCGVLGWRWWDSLNWFFFSSYTHDWYTHSWRMLSVTQPPQKMTIILEYTYAGNQWLLGRIGGAGWGLTATDGFRHHCVHFLKPFSPIRHQSIYGRIGSKQKSLLDCALIVFTASMIIDCIIT